MLNLADHFRSDSSGLSLDEALQQPAAALLGVSGRAADALRRIGVETVFDLGSSWLFANAAAAIEAPSSGLGFSSSDLLDADAVVQTSDGSASLPVESLRGISDQDAAALEQALEIATVRELALWPPRLIAQRLVSEATGSTLDEFDEEPAEALRPRLGEYPTERVYYDSLVMLAMGESANRKPLMGAISLQPVVDDPLGFGQPAVGALVTLSQSWYAKGITLGHMLHSLALAPGEATRIAVVDWSRRTRAAVTESIDEAERLDSATEHSRAISEVQNAVADEMQSGGSMSSGWSKSKSKGKAGGFSVGGGIAGAYKGVTGVLGFGGGSSSSSQQAETRTQARSSSWSIGSRSVVAEMAQRVNDRTEQHSSSVRNRRASAVREVSQSEHEEVSTRVVANYNHMHALTVQYYEVVQVYRVLSQVHSVQRVLFLPFELLDFRGEGAADVVARFRAPLVAAALTERAQALLLDDRGAIEIRSAARVHLPLLAGSLVRATAIASARLVALEPGDGGAGSGGSPPQPPLPGEGPPGGILTAPPPSRGPVVTRPGPILDTIPGDAELTAVSFEGVGVDRVRIDQPGVPAADATFAVPEATDQVDFAAPVSLRTVEAFSVARIEGAPATGTMTVRYTSGSRQASLAVPVELGGGTGMQKVAFLAADPADRRGELMAHLQANRAYYTRAVLEGLDSASLVMLLSAFTWRGKPLADQVEPNPLAVAGNFLVLRAPVEDDEPAGIGDDGRTWGEQVRERALTAEQQDARLVPIPTGGVFAEAVLGRSNSAEKLDITRFWNWQDSPIPLQPPEIAPVGTGSRATAEDLRPGQLGAPVLNILNPTALPDPAGLGAALGTLATANLFRDMSGLAGTQSLAQAAAAGTLGAATEAGQLASANLKTVTDQAVAMGQAAADMWKTLHGPQGNGGGGGGASKGVSADGARINHGRDMDRRGVSGAGARSAPAEAGGSGLMTTGPGTGLETAGGNGGGSGAGAVSRELAFADTAATGISPALLGGTVNALGGGAAAMTPASFPASFLPRSVAQAVADGVVLAIIRQDVEASGVSLQGVDLHPMRKHDNGAKLKDTGIFAWTNSAHAVYVDIDAFSDFSKAKTPLVARGYAAIGLRHEVVHVEQFRKAGGHPGSFKEMVKHELEAYGCNPSSPGPVKKWLDQKGKGGARDFLTGTLGLKAKEADEVLKDVKDQLQKACGTLTTRLKNRLKNVAASQVDEETRLHLIDEELLPEEVEGVGASYKIGDLYKTQPP